MEMNIGFPFMMFACILVGALVLAAAGLVIYNILKISITKGILAAATGIFNPDLFLADSAEELRGAIYAAQTGNPLFLLASVAVTLLFAMAAAFPAARYASRVSPTVAMAGTAVKIKRRVRKQKKIRHFEAYYARLNLKRGGGRTAITVLSLVMSITVYIALQSFTALLDTSSGVKDMHLGDYAVTNETMGISAGAVEEMRASELVESLSTSKLTVYNPYIAEETPPFETDLAV